MRLLMVTMLWFIFGSVKGDTTPYQYLEGRYYNQNLRSEIRVKVRRQYLKVKGLPNSRGWDRFFLVKRNLWMDNLNNRVRINRYGDLMYLDRKGNFRLLYQKGKKDDCCTFDNKDIWRDGLKRPPSKSRRKNQYGYDQYQEEKPSYKIDRQVPSGVWYSKDFRKNVEIRKDRNGFLARIEGKRDWVYFTKTKQGYWQDENHNFYLYPDTYNLIWRSFNGLRTVAMTRVR